MRLTSKERAYQRQLQGGFGSRFRNMTDDQFRAKVQPERFAGNTEQFIGGLGVTGVNTDRGPSPIIWANFPSSEIRENPNKGTSFWDDFTCFGGLVTSNVGNYSSEAGSYRTFETTSATLKMSNTSLPTNPAPSIGVIEAVTPATTANASVSIQAGGVGATMTTTASGGGAFGLTGNVLPSIYFEARCYLNITTLTLFDFFVGLAEVGNAVVVGTGSLINASDSIITNQKSYIGFHSLTAAPTAINASYGKAGVNGVKVANGLGTGTWAAQTWTKLGFAYEPNDKDGRLLKYYQDGNLLGWVTDCSVAAFPTAKTMTPFAVIQNDTTGTNATKLQMDWWKVGVKVMQ